MNKSDDDFDGLLGYIKFLINNGNPELEGLLSYVKKNDIPKSLEEISRLLQASPHQEGLSRILTLLHLFTAREQHRLGGTEFTLNCRQTFISPLRMEDLPEESQQLPLSIIIPVKDELDNLPILYEELKLSLKDIGQPYEIIFIDDGSTDGSTQWLERLPQSDCTVRSIIFRRNYGQTAALSAGFKAARGEIAVTLDADLQNDPADIPILLAKLAEGYDMVCGWRKNRQDAMLSRRLPSQIANKIINTLIQSTGVYLHDFGCSLKAYKIGIVKNIKLYGEMHRFIPVFAAWLGVRIAEIEVNHRPRIHGKAKYGLSRVTRVLFDLLPLRFFSDFVTRPVQFYGKLAIWMLIIGVPMVTILGILGALDIISPVTMQILTMLGLLGISSLIIVCQGMLGEIIIRQYFETQNKDQFVIRSIIENNKQNS